MPGTKRLRLEIKLRKAAPSKLLFSLRDLSTPDHPLLAEGDREVTVNHIKRRAAEWRKELSLAETRFLEGYALITQELTPQLGASRDTAKIVSDPTEHPLWPERLESLEEQFAESVGTLIFEYSRKILFEFFPRLGAAFWTPFRSLLDTPSREVWDKGLENAAFSLPLLQLATHEELASIPWWFAQTPDEASIWSCRYALAVSPSLADTDPPKNLKYTDLRIFSISRPTEDLQSQFPFRSRALALAARERGTEWCLLDGAYGGVTKKVDEGFPDLPEESFRGVEQVDVESAIQTILTNPNVWFYHGHWLNSPTTPDQGLVAPLLALHNKVELDAMPDNQAFGTRRVFFTPLLSLIPPAKYPESLLIMNACSSAAQPELSDFIQQYIASHSVFLGSSYPLKSNPLDSTATDFLEGLLENADRAYLAQILAAAQHIQPTIQEIPRSDLYRKASLCLFGDVRTHLNLDYDPQTKDNVLPEITVKLTTRWKRGLESLGISEGDLRNRLTFGEIREDAYPATSAFELASEPLEIGLCPLAYAIELAVQKPGEYTILGPGFASRNSVGLASPSIEGIDDLRHTISSYLASKTVLRVGVLKPRLTTTFMVKLFLWEQIKQVLPDDQDRWRFSYLMRFPSDYWQGERREFLESQEWREKLDLILLLGEEEIARAKDLGLKILDEDLETSVANRLGVRRLPRGVFFARRDALERFTPVLADFFAEYHLRVADADIQERFAIESPNDIALPTFRDSQLDDLFAIKLFADYAVYRDPSVFSHVHFAHQPTFSAEALDELAEHLVRAPFDPDFLGDMFDEQELLDFSTDLNTARESLAEHLSGLSNRHNSLLALNLPAELPAFLASHRKQLFQSFRRGRRKELSERLIGYWDERRTDLFATLRRTT